MSELNITGRVVSKEIDGNGCIQLNVEYTNVDGSVTSGKLRFDASRFSKELVITALKEHVDRMIIKACNLRDNPVEVEKLDLSDLCYSSATAEQMIKPEVTSNGTIISQKKTKQFDLNEDKSS